MVFFRRETIRKPCNKPGDSRLKIVIIGAKGQLGAELVKSFADLDVAPLTHDDVEIADMKSTRQALTNAVAGDERKDSVVINAAAYLPVDACELHPDRAYEINAAGAGNVARAAAELGMGVVQFSTDYVFDGRKTTPYVETDATNPINVYGASKLAGEREALNANPRCRVIRTSGLYGLAKPSKRSENFVDMILRQAREGETIRGATDQTLTPTYTRSLAAQVRLIIERAAEGVFHATNRGECAWMEFANEILRLAGYDICAEPMTLDALKRPAARPAYSALDNAALRERGLDIMEDWREALAKYFRDSNIV